MLRLSVIWLPLLTANLIAASPDPKEIVRLSVQGDRTNRERLRDFVYVQRTENRRLDGKGGFSKRESETFEVMSLYGSEYRKKIAENDQPLTQKEAAKVERELAREEEKRRNETESQRRVRTARQEKNRAEIRALLAEIPEAYDFTLVGEETVRGRATWVVDARPKSGYKPKVDRADLLTKFKGRFWVDKSSYQWVRLDAETVDTVSFGWILFRLQKGAVLHFEQTPLSAGFWVPVRIESKANLKLGLLKSLSGEFEVTFRDWRKFSTDSRLVGVEELEAVPPD